MEVLYTPCIMHGQEKNGWNGYISRFLSSNVTYHPFRVFLRNWYWIETSFLCFTEFIAVFKAFLSYNQQDLLFFECPSKAIYNIRQINKNKNMCWPSLPYLLLQSLPQSRKDGCIQYLELLLSGLLILEPG